MAVIVQKYGGTSVGSLSRIEAVAESIIQTRQQGHQVVAVLSAMSGETNRLLNLAYQLDDEPATRELDMLVSTGEQVSIALLAIALIKRGYSAVSLLAHQVGIITDNHFGHARIKEVRTQRLLQALEQEQVVLVAGFQGIDSEQNVTTLGRGGSDTSAVAIAAALGASECQIFTDVDGIYSADPRIEPQAQKLDYISFDEMLAMANLGAKVLHNRSVEYAMQHQLPIRVLSSFELGNGTKVTHEAYELQQAKNTIALAHQLQQMLIIIKNVDDKAFNEFFTALQDEHIEVSMLVKNNSSSRAYCYKFSAAYRNKTKIELLFIKYCAHGTLKFIENCAKVSLISKNLFTQNDFSAQIKHILEKENINIHFINTSLITFSILINEIDITQAIHLLHNQIVLKLNN